VSACVDVRIDAQADGRAHAELAGDAVDALELAFRFDVEAEDAGPERGPDVLLRFADTGKDDFRRVASRREHALQLSPRHDVETAAETAEEIEDREARIRFHRVAHEVLAPRERGVEARVGVREGRA
jgi:hypothetical protein